MASVDKILMIVHFERSFSRSWPGPNVIQVGVKSLFMSKFTHILLALPNPSEAIFKEIDEIFAKFIWQNKPPNCRIRLDQIQKIFGNRDLNFEVNFIILAAKKNNLQMSIKRENSML